MEQIRKFLQGKGFALVLAACLLAAAAAGVWAVQTVRGELQKNLDGLRDPASSARTAPGIDEGLDLTTPDEEDSTEWQQPTAPPQTLWPMCPKLLPAPRPPVGLVALLGHQLVLLGCASPPRCKPNPPLPAAQRRLPPRGQSRGVS